MPKTRPKRGPSENDIKFKDEIDTPNNQPLSQKDRFWKLARQYMRGQMQSPWEWMNADDDTEAAQESHEDYLDSLSDMPGMGQYVGDYQLNQQGQVVPGGTEEAPQTPSGGSYGALGGQVTPEGLFPPGTTTEADQYTQDLISGEVTSYPQQVPYRPREELSQPAPLAGPQPTSIEGVPPDQLALAQKYGQQFGVDPNLLLAIAKHETQFGQAGLGKKGLTLGYGAFDSGASMKWAGPDNQYRHGAQTLSKWGAKTLDDVLAGKASSWATDPKWEQGIQRAYGALAPQLAKGPTDVFDQVLNDIQAGKIDPSVLDTLGPGLSSLADTTSQTADANEALAYDPETDEDEDD